MKVFVILWLFKNYMTHNKFEIFKYHCLGPINPNNECPLNYIHVHVYNETLEVRGQGQLYKLQFPQWVLSA